MLSVSLPLKYTTSATVGACSRSLEAMHPRNKFARYEYLLNLPDNAQVGEAINHAMELIEEQSAQLKLDEFLERAYSI